MFSCYQKMAKIISCNSACSEVVDKNADDSQTYYGSGIPRMHGFHLLNIASTAGVIKAFIAVFGESHERGGIKKKTRVSRVASDMIKIGSPKHERLIF